MPYRSIVGLRPSEGKPVRQPDVWPYPATFRTDEMTHTPSVAGVPYRAETCEGTMVEVTHFLHNWSKESDNRIRVIWAIRFSIDDPTSTAHRRMMGTVYSSIYPRPDDFRG